MINEFELLKKDLDESLDQKLIMIHIKLKQRNGKKCITIIEGLEQIEKENKEKFFETIAKCLKKKFNCGVSIKKPFFIIQLSGDHRNEIKDYLINKKLLKEDQIKVHGY